MNHEQLRVIRELRDEGYSVAVFFPEEMPDSRPETIEAAMCEAAWLKIKADTTISPLKEYADNLKVLGFGERQSLKEAMDYVRVMAVASDNPLALLTAVYVVTNSIAGELLTIARETEK